MPAAANDLKQALAKTHLKFARTYKKLSILHKPVRAFLAMNHVELTADERAY